MIRRSFLSLAALVLSLGRARGFVIHAAPRCWHALSSPRGKVQLGSAVESSAGSEQNRRGRSKAEIDKELSSGKILEGGQVIDFSAVKGPSRAEKALLEARASSARHGGIAASPSDEILGINAEVIQEVGHDLGTFADTTSVQRCAAYLRSQAPVGFFQTKEGVEAINDFSAKDIASMKELLRKAYEESGEVTGAFAKTFYMGTQLLNEAAREAIWAIYVWCRRTDEIVDAPRDNDDEMLSDLSQWEMRLENLWRSGQVEDVFDLCLLDVRIKYPKLSITPFVDMIRGMLMDVPNLGQERYDTFEELHLYCYRVAGTVGLMSMPIFGCAPGCTDEDAKEPALSLGVAFQLTNILRDVGEDGLERGRIYLPRDDMERFGVTEEQIFERRLDDNYVRMMKFQISRARLYYERARRGVFMLAPESRLPVQLSLDAYGKILDKIEENGHDSLNYRAYVDKWEKLSLIPFAYYRTLDISKTFPLPGDRPVGQVADLTHLN